MPLSIDITTPGMDKFRAAMAEFDKLGSVIKSAGLKDRAREAYPWATDAPTNTDILRVFLPAGGRDFASQDPEVEREVSAAFEGALELYVAALERARGDSPPPSIDSFAAKAWLAAMRAYMQVVTDRIEQQRAAGGGGIDALSPAYAAFKNSKVGFSSPAGKLSGQLLDNLNPDGASLRNIRLSR